MVNGGEQVAEPVRGHHDVYVRTSARNAESDPSGSAQLRRHHPQLGSPQCGVLRFVHGVDEEEKPVIRSLGRRFHRTYQHFAAHVARTELRGDLTPRIDSPAEALAEKHQRWRAFRNRLVCSIAEEVRLALPGRARHEEATPVRGEHRR
jgi:hypothetical protein